MRLLIFTGFFLCFFTAKAQLGFCSGSKGDPIFHEDFGSGTGTGPALSSEVTNYNFVNGDPNDGQYTISDDIGNEITSWHSMLPNQTNTNGRALIVNADFTAGRFYRTEVSGLCESTTYEFSAFLMNVYDRGSQVCVNGGIPINVRFEIWDETDSVLLKEGNTGDITSRTSPQWEQYALTFQSQPGQGSVILKMFNNGEGGCGNDLAIDDIIFRSCGDLISITSSEGLNETMSVCEEETPVQVNLNATPDNAVYTSHYYQWQQSDNGLDWSNIPGEISENFNNSTLSVSKYYRVKVAESQINLSGNLCNVASDPFYVKVFEKPKAPESLGDKVVCGNEPIPALEVKAEADEEVNWYDSSSGGNLVAENTKSFLPTREGIFYAEAVKINSNCEPGPRTAVSLRISETPETNDENLEICPNSQLFLDAGIPGLQYSWSTGETTQSVNVNSAGTYSVEMTNSVGCSAIKEFVVEPVPQVGIADIISEEEKVTIVPAYEGEFLYSLDGTNFQSSNIFNSVSGGIYTAYMKDRQSCNSVSLIFPHIVIPGYISPNNDGYHDRFEIKGLEYFEFSSIIIFDRYGKFIAGDSGENFSWDGKYKGRPLPSGDYWYQIKISGFPDQTGHFSLIR